MQNSHDSVVCLRLKALRLGGQLQRGLGPRQGILEQIVEPRVGPLQDERRQRGDGRPGRLDQLAVLEAMLGFARAAPTYAGVVQGDLWRRRLPRDFVGAHREGGLVQYAGFTGTAKPGGDTLGGDIQLIIHQRAGADIQALSLYPEQREVLLPPGARLRVSHVRGSILELEQIDSDAPVPASARFALPEG